MSAGLASPPPSPPPISYRLLYSSLFHQTQFRLEERGKSFKIAAFIFTGTPRIKNEHSPVMELSDSDEPYSRVYSPNSIILQETLQTLRAIPFVSSSSSSFLPLKHCSSWHVQLTSHMRFIDACLNCLPQWSGVAVRCYW
jgi:hypothetical protein